MNDKQPSTTGRVRTRRDVLRRHRRERQFFVFGVLIIALGAVAFSAASVYSGRTSGPFHDPIITIAGNLDDGVSLPCPPAILPVEPSRVVVRVLNSTGRQGLAANTMGKLTGRGFISGGATNWTRSYDESVRISFGSEGVAQAYTVARHFEDVEFVQDSRSGKSVDVILGLEFSEITGVRPQFAPELDPDSLLAADAQCVPPGTVVEEPAPRVYPADLPEITPEPTVSPTEAAAVDNSETSD